MIISRDFRQIIEMGDSKKVLVLVAPGAEEMETVISVDVLRRAGVSVTMAGVVTTDTSPAPLTCSRGVQLCPDTVIGKLASSDTWDCVLLPGGPGHKVLVDSQEVGDILRRQEAAGGII